MAGTLQNRNAQKWTLETVTVTLDKIEKDATDGDIFYLGSALSKYRITRKAWSYWKKIFRRNEDMLEQMELIENIFEKKIFEGALKGELVVSVAIFALKNNHRWTEKPVMEIVENEPEYPENGYVRLNRETIIRYEPGNGGKEVFILSSDDSADSLCTLPAQ